MALHRDIDGSDPARAQPIFARASAQEIRELSRSFGVAAGTLACPRCDAPIALGGRAAHPAEELDCPFCRHAAPARDFLSLAAPSRPARVELRAFAPARATRPQR